jgi:phosphoenolpyruvate carboxykinase (GTP)
VNWFRKDEAGKFVWPGYGENMRVLAWILGRVENKAKGENHMFGVSPSHSDLIWEGLNFTQEQFNQVISIDKAAWSEELKLHEELFAQLAHGLPTELVQTKAKLEEALSID